MIVRDARASDMPDMLSAVACFTRELCDGVRMDAEHVTSVLSDLIVSDDGLLAVLEDGGRVVGMFAALAHKHMISGARVCGEVLFYTAPAARGHGLKLLRYAEAWARERDCHAMMMGHMAATPGLETAFRRWGYAPTERFYKKDLG